MPNDADKSQTRVIMLLGANELDVLRHVAPESIWQPALDWKKMYVIGAQGERPLSEEDAGRSTERGVFFGASLNARREAPN